MGHSYNHGLVTSMKGPALEAVRITGMNTSPCTIQEQGAAGLVASATIAAGIVTVQLALPYPPKLIICHPYVSGSNATQAVIYARFVQGSYNATTGQFQVALSNAPGPTPTAATPAAADELHLLLIFKRYNILPA